MKKFAGFTKAQVDAELKWVARHSTGYRFIGTYEELTAHCALYEDDEYDYIKDIDLLCKEGQNPEMQKFMDALEAHEKVHGFTLFGELFDKYGEED